MSDTDMVTVADAIRSKTGGSDPLSFPTGFSEAIEGISGGGEGGGESAYEALGRALVDSFEDVSGSEYTLKVADFVDALPPYYANPLKRVLWSYMFQGRTITSIDWTGVSDLVINPHAFNNVLFKGSNPSIPAGIGINSGYTFYYAKELGGYPVDASYTVVPDTMCGYATFTDDLVIPEGVTQISGGAFGNISRNTNVELTVTLPSTLTTISGYAGVSGTYTTPLKLVVNAMVPPTLSASASIHSVRSITVPAGTLSAYQTATNWAQFADIMVEASA